MGEVLFGGERSGTPLETRGGSADLAKLFQQMISSGGFGGTGTDGRMGSESWVNMLGFDPREAGLGDAATRALRNPADSTQGLFSSLEPFEQRQTQQQVGGLREIFGTMGGRFSDNIGSAEGELRSGLANEFLRTRQQGLLDAQGQQNQFLASLFQSIPGLESAGNDRLRIASQFLAPGSPIFTEGLAPGILGAAGNLAGLYFLGGGGGFGAGGGGGAPFQYPGPLNNSARFGPRSL